MKLAEILEKNPIWNYTIPKGSRGTDKNTIHSYVDHFYEEHFLPYKDKPISLLEVGISNGDCLFLWNEYFTNNTQIVGLDVYDYRSKELREHSKIKSYIVKDAYDVNFISTIPNFDIIIDDGPHTLESQCFFLEHYLQKVNPGGTLIIEDVADPAHFEIFKNIIGDRYSNYKCVDLRSVKNRFDDLMFVVNK